MSVNRQWLLVRRPQGMMSLDDFKYHETPFTPPELKPGEVLVRNTFFSLVPAQRTWMNADSAYFPPMQLGKPVVSPAVAEVVASANPKYPVGAMVTTLTGWEDYTLLSGEKFWAGLLPAGVDPVQSLSLFGGNTLTAYFGLLKIGQPKASETVVVSGAAGSTGSMAAQIARIKGCKVIGIAGGKAKCDWLTGELGFDGAIDYKNEDVGAALDRLCPNGIDVNFENVGGDIMDAVVSRMNNFGRMALCGMISTYNDNDRPAGPTDFVRVLMHRLTIRGFIITDFLPRAGEAMAELIPWVMEGKIKWKVHIDQGLDGAMDSLQRLFTGDHDGKLLIQVSPEP